MDDELMTQVEESGYSLEEILIIASLIEKETDGKDRTNIASVIYNRLNNVGETYHKLEIDAAVIYGLGYANGENYAGPLTQADRESWQATKDWYARLTAAYLDPNHFFPVAPREA